MSPSRHSPPYEFTIARDTRAVRPQRRSRPVRGVAALLSGRERRRGEARRNTIAFTKRHELDLIKFNPRAHYHAEPWGTRYRYGRDGRPGLERYAVTKPEHWARIRRKTMREPAFRELLYGLRLVREVLPETPLLATIFTPLGVLERLAGTERVLADLP